MFLVLLSLISSILMAKCVAQPAGWKMTDRFYGFRYEITTKSQFSGVVAKIVREADLLGCFGWIQEPSTGVFVGEARCSKVKGPKLQEFISTAEFTQEYAVRVYEDTKIRLHFSHFKVLEPNRDTCFVDAPHQCSDVIKEQEVDSTDTSHSTVGSTTINE